MKKQFWALLTIGFIALNFIACGKKGPNTQESSPICSAGTYYNPSTGTCLPGNGSSQYPTPYANNGTITNGSVFRDLVQRTFGRYYRCYDNNPGYYNGIDYGCRALQVQLQKVTDQTYRVNIRSAAMLGSQGSYIAGYIYTGQYAQSASLGNGFAIQVSNTNPYQFVEMKIIVDRPLTQDGAMYIVEFNRREIARGQMRKGRDY